MAKKQKISVNEEELSSRIEKQLERANQWYASDIEPHILADRELYISSKEYYRKKFPKVSRISEIVTSDVANTIEWAIPGVMRVFYSSDDIFTIQGVDPQDDERAKTNKALVDYQWQRESEGFLLFYDWIKMAMKERVSIVKCYWERNSKTEVMEVDASPMELDAMRKAGFDITSVTPKQDGLITVTYKEQKLVKNSPKFEVLSIADLRWSPEATSLDTSNFVAQRIITDMDYIRRRGKEGFYKNADKITPGNMTYTQYEQKANNFQQRDGEEDQEDALKPVILYEIYMRTDINGDGMAEDVVVHWCNKQILKIQENTMGRHPFFLATPIREPRSIYPLKGFAELLGELQDIKTALLRQIIANVAINNDKQAFVNVDVMVDVNEFVQGKKAVRVTGDPRNAVYYIPAEPIPPQVFTLFEYLESTKETSTGVTRYNQGQDASSLNKMLALDTPIPMADGSYKTNGEIVDGDLVIGSNGKPTVVLHAHPVQMPETAYEMTFQSGDVIKSGGEHRWAVKISDKNYKNKSPEFIKLTTDYINDLMNAGKRVYIPRIDGSKQRIVSIKEIPVEPMRCLTVAAEDELYCCGRRFTVTSNTATGITQIMGAANQRLEMIVRLIAEGGVKPMLRHLIKMNQMYMTDEMTIRIANKPLQFSPDDLQGEIDVSVNSGVGTGIKQTQIQNLQLLVSMYQLTIQAGAADPSHLAYAFSKLAEELGFKNTTDFGFAPEEVRARMQQQQEAAAKEQEMMMQMKQQMMGGQGGATETGEPGGAAPAGTITPGGDGQIDPRLLGALAG